MKEASGELNMTVVTIVAIAAILGLFWALWPSIKDKITGTWDNIDQNTNVEDFNYINPSDLKIIVPNK